MYLFLILPILTAGFIACNVDPKCYFRIHRYDGQYLYLKCAKIGLFWFLFSLGLSLSLSRFLPDHLSICEHSYDVSVIAFIESLLSSANEDVAPKDLRTTAWVMLLSVLTILFSYLWAKYRELMYGLFSYAGYSSSVWLMESILRDSPMDNFLFESLLSQRAVLLSMDNEKAYVGIVITMGEPNESDGMDQEIEILPILSGYRDSTTKKLKLIHDYLAVDVEGKSLCIVLPQARISSASNFDMETYSHFMKSKGSGMLEGDGKFYTQPTVFPKP